jgi:hypothetical protein
MRGPQFTVEQMREAIERGHTKAAAARELGCAWMTVDRYCKRHPTLRDALHAAKMELVDLAQTGLRQAVVSGDLGAIKYVLSTLGKDEGYQETVRNEHTGANGERLVIRLTWADTPPAPSAPDADAAG